MKLLCWNINSLVPTVRNAVLKYGSWLGFFKEHGIDILCLQESKVPDDKLTKELCCVEGFQSFWAASRERRGYSGVTTYASESYAPLSCEVDCLGSEFGSGDDELDREGRVVITDHGAFVLVNVYVPNAGDRPQRARLDFKLRFLAALQRKCDELAAAGRELLVVGDFNVPAEARDVHPDLLPAGKLEELYSAEELSALRSLTASYPDVWRKLHPDACGVYSVWDEKTSARAFNRGLRIDYVLCTPGLLDRVVSCELLGADVLPPKWSDHAGLLLELRDIPPLPPHPHCQAWQRLHRRFVDTSQKSIMGMFGAAGKKRAAQQQQQQQSEATCSAAGAQGAAERRPAAEMASSGASAAGAAASDCADGEARDGRDPKKPRRSEVAAALAANAVTKPAQAAVRHGCDGRKGADAARREQREGQPADGAAAPSETRWQHPGGEPAQQLQVSGDKPAVASRGSGRGRGSSQQQNKAGKNGAEAGQRTIGSFFAAAAGGADG